MGSPSWPGRDFSRRVPVGAEIDCAIEIQPAFRAEEVSVRGRERCHQCAGTGSRHRDVGGVNPLRCGIRNNPMLQLR